MVFRLYFLLIKQANPDTKMGPENDLFFSGSADVGFQSKTMNLSVFINAQK